MKQAYAIGPPADEAGYRLIRLGWSFDDGPTPHTAAMADVIAPRAATWFIMNDRLGGAGARRGSAFAKLLGRREQGDEIAIHSMHPIEGHAAWFPISLGSVPQAYASTAAAMHDLRAFTLELRAAGLRPHFARMPGGEWSEVKKYVEVAGGPRRQSGAIARALLSGQAPPVPAPPVVVRDLALVRSTVASLGLHLWDGSASGPELSTNTWEVESSGVRGRTDDVVRRFIGLADRLARGARTRPASFVILAHDTTRADATRAASNVRQMEDYATARGVRVEYHSMSSLYQIVRERPPVLPLHPYGSSDPSAAGKQKRSHDFS